MNTLNLINLLSVREEYQFLIDEYGCNDASDNLDNINSCISKILNEIKVPYCYKIEIYGIEFELDLYE
jgi:hypothetical protein